MHVTVVRGKEAGLSMKIVPWTEGNQGHREGEGQNHKGQGEVSLPTRSVNCATLGGKRKFSAVREEKQ